MADQSSIEDYSKLQGCSVRELKSYTTTGLGDVKNGQHWANWVCCKKRTTVDERIQTRLKPAGLNDIVWKTWDCRTKTIKNKGQPNEYTQYGQVKLIYTTVTYRVKYPNDIIPAVLGQGNSISHLCDTAGCINPDHIAPGFVHQQNMDRQRCEGLTLLVDETCIIQEFPCRHTPCCTRIKVLKLNDYAVQSIYLNNFTIHQ